MGAQAWCRGPMCAIFDAAAEGDVRAREQAQQVCGGCPLLDSCRSAYVNRSWTGTEPAGVIGGIFVGVLKPERESTTRRGLVAA